MTVPVEKLSRNQKFWYANLVIAAILADNEINISEVDFLKHIIAVVDPLDRPLLMKSIEAKKSPPLVPPPEGIPNVMLAAIYLELILIIISDIDFAEDEKKFLAEVSSLIGFTEAYFNELMAWLKEGLAWKQAQTKLSTGEGLRQVPLKNFTPPQKKWYATALVATILLDGQIDPMELTFLKMAVSCVESKEDQASLMAYVKNRVSPKLPQAPAGMSQEVLTLIFEEILLLMSTDEAISYSEQTFLKQVATQCGFDHHHVQNMIAWCNAGVKWKNDKNGLMAKVAIKAQPKPKAPGTTVSKDNNSLVPRKVQCFVCGSNQPALYFQLKPNSQKPSRDIFGITTYREANKGFDFIDYNRIAPIVCPQCYYASYDKFNFKRQEGDKAPVDLLNPKFAQAWSQDRRKWEDLLGSELTQVQEINRSFSAVEKTYHLCIEAERRLWQLNQDPKHRWELVVLLITLAELQITEHHQAAAEESLKQAIAEAKEVFLVRDNLMVYKAGRMLFLLGLYFGDKDLSGTYYNFLLNVSSKPDELKDEEKKILMKIMGEAKKAFENRAEYAKTALDGFHLKEAPPKAKKGEAPAPAAK